MPSYKMTPSSLNSMVSITMVMHTSMMKINNKEKKPLKVLPISLQMSLLTLMLHTNNKLKLEPLATLM